MPRVHRAVARALPRHGGLRATATDRSTPAASGLPATATPARAGGSLGREASGFATVGAFALLVDIGGYNALVHLGGNGWLGEEPLLAKTTAVAASTTVAYFGNRFWTYRDRPRGRLGREYVLFVVLSAVGLAIALACLAFSRYVLGLTSAVADNVATNGIGLALGSLFRFLTYRRYVFPHRPPA
ncbi:GtrA family protein [Blastococcus deserti]|uniref:GtrA family protein n=1 Tax=Blastococcus deserti TaxID=2259033 RepID=A0ABW4XEP3_9ACTN